MTPRDEHEDTYLTGTERPSGPSALWLAAIPMVAISLIGLAASLPILTRASADQSERPLRTGEAGAAAPSDNPPMRAEALIADRFRPPITSPTTVSAARTTPPPTAPPAPTAPAVPATSGTESTSTFGCGAALAWLSTHAAPGFRFECPGDALGHQGMTCVNVAGVCPGERIIAIADACPAAYMNEAHNSWVLLGLAAGPLDPYGYCG